MKVLLAIIMTQVVVGYGCAGRLNSNCELQERCRTRAESLFITELPKQANVHATILYGNAIVILKPFMDLHGDSMTNNITTNYNSKLNKCYMVITNTMVPGNKKLKKSISKVLYDVDERKEYGGYYGFIGATRSNYCDILQDNCISEQEWDNMARIYMEQ